jgi:trehalose 6-phosphate phosphatase
MNNPYFPNMQEVGERVRRAAHVLLGLDYDGALTPIVDEPSLALLPEAMRQAIWTLTQREDMTVTVISGRTDDDLRKQVGIPGIIYAGNHGMEISGPGISFIEPGAKSAAPELHTLVQLIARKLQHIPGAMVEDKGLSLSVHYRRVAPVDGEEVWHTVHDIVASKCDQFQVTLGNKVYEVRPLLRWNKGSALAWIKGQIHKPDTLVIYIGDDKTDEDVFRTLGEETVTIRVGDDTQSAARFLVPDSATVQHFLHWLNELRENREGSVY